MVRQKWIDIRAEFIPQGVTRDTKLTLGPIIPVDYFSFLIIFNTLGVI